MTCPGRVGKPTLKICALKTIGEPVGMTKEEMIALYEDAKKNMMDCSEAICSSVAAVSDAAEGETELEAENEVDASTKSSDAASASG